MRTLPSGANRMATSTFARAATGRSLQSNGEFPATIWHVEITMVTALLTSACNVEPLEIPPPSTFAESSDGSLMARQFGFGDDIITPGDYDGDGKSDVSVYRYSNHSFYTLRSTDGGFNGFAWGSDLDILVVGDYTNGPRSDVCVWRPSSGTFYCLGDGGAGSFTVFHFGQTGDVPVGSSNVH